MAHKLSHLLVPFLLLQAIQPFIVHSRTLKSTGQSVNYLQNLEGSHKGQTLKGLKELKLYLQAFGYYPNDNNLTDDFDDLLESALKTYQKNYNLKITGSLDSNTIKQITIPQCGVPDIINRPTSKPTGETKDGSKTSNSPLVADYSFFPGMPKWRPSKTNLTYTFSSGVQVIDMQTMRTVVSSAFNKWADESNFRFNEASEGAQADIVIGFQRGDHGDGSPFDGPGFVLAHAFAPENGRFHYDADENWSTNPVSYQVDLESVAVHEIGHLLGLGHSMDPNAIMFREFNYGDIKRELTQDDINGINALYPN